MMAVKALYWELRATKIIGRGFTWVLHGGQVTVWSIMRMEASISRFCVLRMERTTGLYF